MDVKKLTQEFIDDFLGYYINPKNRYMNSLLIESGLPGGMMGSLMNDLEKSLLSINKWLNKNNKNKISIDLLFSYLLDEVKLIWPILGYPPLVTPYSQYVKNVALANVIQNIKGKEKWSLIDDNTWDMLLGKSGKLPGKLSDEIIKLSKKLNKTFYTKNPQDIYEDVLDINKKEMKKNDWKLGQDDEELLEYSLHKTQYIDFKSGKAKKRFNEDLLIKRKSNNMDEKLNDTETVVLDIDGNQFKVEYSLSSEGKDLSYEKLDGQKLLSPIEGRIFLTKESNETPVKINDVVNKGDILCYIESMKVINAIKSEYSGKIVKICFNDGDDIDDDDVLFLIK
jgi:pyruvate carboxylase subunit B